MSSGVQISMSPNTHAVATGSARALGLSGARCADPGSGGGARSQACTALVCLGGKGRTLCRTRGRHGARRKAIPTTPGRHLDEFGTTAVPRGAMQRNSRYPAFRNTGVPAYCIAVRRPRPAEDPRSDRRPCSGSTWVIMAQRGGMEQRRESGNPDIRYKGSANRCSGRPGFRDGASGSNPGIAATAGTVRAGTNMR